MAARRDHYEVLGVPPDADATAIKNVSRRYHRDIRTEPDAKVTCLQARVDYGQAAESDCVPGAVSREPATVHAHTRPLEQPHGRGARMPRVAGTSVTCALAACCRPWP